MNSLLLALTLTQSPAVAAQPFGYPPPFPGPPVPVFRPSLPFPPSAPPSAGPMTIEQFVHCFRPTPGAHHVWLVHPKTCQPVQVCFTLPHCANPPKVRHGRRYIEFDFGKLEVEINFRHNGTVDVDYDD